MTVSMQAGTCGPPAAHHLPNVLRDGPAFGWGAWCQYLGTQPRNPPTHTPRNTQRGPATPLLGFCLQEKVLGQLQRNSREPGKGETATMMKKSQQTCLPMSYPNNRGGHSPCRGRLPKTKGQRGVEVSGCQGTRSWGSDPCRCPEGAKRQEGPPEELMGSACVNRN